MTHFSFGKAKLEDVLRISVLLKTVYIQTYAEEGVTFEFAKFIEKRFSVDYIEKMILENPHQLIIAYFNNNPIGAAEVHFQSLCPIRKIPIPELSKLYVLKRFFQKKVGQGLMKECEKLLLEKGYNEIYLEVAITNNRAISFYKKQGFLIIGEADFPMEVNVYKNWVMSKSIPPST